MGKKAKEKTAKNKGLLREQNCRKTRSEVKRGPKVKTIFMNAGQTQRTLEQRLV